MQRSRDEPNVTKYCELIANVCELYHLNNCGLHLVGELVNNSMDSYESLNRVSVTKLGVPSGKCQRGEFVYLL